ncbi:MAG: biotin--[acetyl-CoA-carboxylase] ligase [Smithellaceae bacterium]|jgi:BirA family biotin operon repressor/biotin-[acetyl-CoA-carboxylase] ligase|nr:biotin--[acetyl-CoA-carboxylase] ligase [Smithellaceae bacterium]MDD3258553.1 biotin--[acetyl-CoA-carboxylase] ligase [Smithellaceae bacterium]MDD3849487.1 biotin--[acetyl-CoA-carboxylase] ligase [Smithellaceae bacterium]HOG11935.1 biotin--[acetyl-CoA-carboxylase] ligase [Smithellaceae bacterium]HOQ71858.1 biotin--[acetyl-CoA-carboxylase] ligase [Smithellaceae bacterium]
MPLNQSSLKQSLAGRFIGHTLYYYEEIGSTNDEVFRLGMQGAPEGTAVIAERQSAGKGRMQRTWHSPPGANIYTSILLRPRFSPGLAPQISLAAGVAVAKTLEPYCPGRVFLKWPNDVQIGGKKVCGILTQMRTAGDAVDFVVAGIGVNVNWKRKEFPEDIRGIATSLSMEAGREISRLELIILLYENLAKCYRELAQKGFAPVRKQWLERTAMLGKPVSVQFGKETIRGEAVDLDEDGSLVLLAEGQKMVKVAAGDATVGKE